MKIEHVAIWVIDIEAMKAFYETYFNGTANAKDCNKEKKFESYFLAFDEGARLEIMCKLGINQLQQAHSIGWAHIAISPGKQGSRQPNDSSLTKGWLPACRWYSRYWRWLLRKCETRFRRQSLGIDYVKTFM